MVGEPGIGKTRLLGEFASSVAGEARVLTGHCLPYGEGITYWPLAEIVRDLAGDDRSQLAGYLASDERGELVCDLLLGAIGAVERAGSVEETQWAVRRLLEALAREQPLVVVFEDLHWAEPTLLQLVEYLAGCSTGSPILLLAAARDELLEQRSAWALPRPNAQLLPLGALSESEGEMLIGRLAGGARISGAMRARISRTGAGNPLFLEQLLALQAEEGETDDELPLPVTIKALLAARLDRLTTLERDLLERAAVEGVAFHRGPVTALLPASEQAEVGPSLLSGIRRNLIRPGRSEFPGDDGYQFVHVLVHDAVYESMPKELRAQLHEQFAAGSKQAPAETAAGSDEILGYHLEQAYKLHAELGPTDDATRLLARRAAELLAAGGQAARLRGDMSAATNLLTRAVGILPARDPFRLGLLPDLGQALRAAGEYRRATETLAEAVAGAQALGDEALEARACLQQIELRGRSDPRYSGEERVRDFECLVGVFERLGDQEGLALALLEAANWRSELAITPATEQAMERARLQARRAGNAEIESWALIDLGVNKRDGPTPVPEALAFLDALLDKADQIPSIAGYVLGIGGELLAMQGRIDEARANIAQTTAMDDELGARNAGCEDRVTGGRIELLAGNVELAEQKLRHACELLASLGATSVRSTALGMLADALYQLGKLDDAEETLAAAVAIAQSDDIYTQVPCRSVAAKVRARRGDHAQADRLAREAVSLIEKTGRPVYHARALLDLAEVLRLGGRPTEAIPVIEQAIQLYERKEATFYAEQARALLAELTAPVLT